MIVLGFLQLQSDETFLFSRSEKLCLHLLNLPISLLNFPASFPLQFFILANYRSNMPKEIPFSKEFLQ
jgi:hypothetical protein